MGRWVGAVGWGGALGRWVRVGPLQSASLNARPFPLQSAGHGARRSGSSAQRSRGEVRGQGGGVRRWTCDVRRRTQARHLAGTTKAPAPPRSPGRVARRSVVGSSEAEPRHEAAGVRPQRTAGAAQQAQRDRRKPAPRLAGGAKAVRIIASEMRFDERSYVVGNFEASALAFRRPTADAAPHAFTTRTTRARSDSASDARNPLTILSSCADPTRWCSTSATLL